MPDCRRCRSVAVHDADHRAWEDRIVGRFDRVAD